MGKKARKKKSLISGKQSRWFGLSFVVFVALSQGLLLLVTLAQRPYQTLLKPSSVKGLSTLSEESEQNPFSIIEEDFIRQFEQQGVKASVIISNLSGDESLAISSDKLYRSASLYKLFTGYKTLEGYQNGTIKKTAKTSNCLRQSIIVSSNSCGFYLGDLLGWESLDKQLANQGFDATVLDNYVGEDIEGDKFTNPKDVAKLLGGVWGRELLNERYAAQFIGILSDQQVNDRVPRSLPIDLTIAHKTANLNGSVHDAGFLINKGSESYLYVIMTTGWEDEEEAVDNIKTFIGETIEVLYK